MLVVPSVANNGSQVLGQTLLDADTWNVDLFKNDYTPDLTSELSDFTVADYPGYSDLEAANFAFDSYDSQKRAVFLADQLTFERTSTGTAQNVYGYFVTNANGDLVWAERFATGPYTMENSGDQIVFRPRFTFRSEFPYICVL